MNIEKFDINLAAASFAFMASVFVFFSSILVYNWKKQAKKGKKKK